MPRRCARIAAAMLVRVRAAAARTCSGGSCTHVLWLVGVVPTVAIVWRQLQVPLVDEVSRPVADRAANELPKKSIDERCGGLHGESFDFRRRKHLRNFSSHPMKIPDEAALGS